MSHFVTFVLCVYLAALPIFIFYFMRKRTAEELEDDEVIDKYGAVYEGLKIKRKQGLSYNVMFTLRRAVFAATLVFAVEHSWL